VGLRLSAVEVKLGKPTLEDVGETGLGVAWASTEPPAPGMETLGEQEEEWVDIVVGVELQPWPDRVWLTLWNAEDRTWPEHLTPPLLDGRMLVFEAREDELEGAWAAVKARVEKTNRVYREEYSLPEHEPDAAEQESLTRLREIGQRRVDALE
jgi:hypothetical protein